MPASAPLAPPSILFGDLYRAVELLPVFADSKTFADAVPQEAPVLIMADYARARLRPGFDLRRFVAAHFRMPQIKSVPYRFDPKRGVQAYISIMWNVLTRQPDEIARWSSLLPLPYPYVVPGGRFSEIYGWDTYFVMLGLEQDGRGQLARDMARNIASLLDRYGHVPNGNRTYYLSRSDPPFLPCMLDLLAEHEGPQVYIAYLPRLRREYEYWMDGERSLRPGQAFRHLVRLADGTLLNRYWDDRDAPRDESYLEDVELSRQTRRPAPLLWRDLRAGSESGWDFSSRWLADGIHLETIRTTQILPVDLNSVLVHLEQTLAYAYRLKGDTARAAEYDARAARRIAAINRLMWQPARGAFFDYVWTESKPGFVLSAATAAPLFFDFATPDQARRVASTIARRLLGPGGMATTAIDSGQQWDSPNGWAPMQWLAVIGLRHYGRYALAQTIARRWIRREVVAYRESGVLLEKYNVKTFVAAGGHGGEYPLQVGFGWTNGVLTSLMALYPHVVSGE